MERWLSFCWLGSLSLLLAVLLILIPSTGKKKLPPGPWTLPIIGCLHHIVKLLPHRALMELSRQHGPLMLLKLGQVPTLVVSGADEAALVMKTNGLVFASRPASVTQKIFGCGGKGINFAPYGDHWRRMRKLCIRELLCPKQVRRMERIRVEEVGNLIHNIAASASTGATINFSHKMVELGNNVVFRAVFGAKCTSQEEFLRELDTAFVLLGGFFLVDLFPSSRLLRWLSHVERDMTQSCSRIHRIITNNIHERRVVRAAGEEACSTDDEVLVDVLLRLQQEDLLDFPLTTEIISAVLFDMFTGGTQTTGTVLEWTMSELVRNPEAMAKAQKEVREVIGRDRAVITNNDLAQLHYLRMVIKEVLRLHPPATLIPRMAREDCTIMSYDIPKNTNILINVFAISRDPRYWDNPDVFKPERFQNKNINYKGAYSEFTPFGAGRRKCPGIEFARSVIEIAVANLLYHFDWMCPDGSSESSVDMYEKFGITVNRRSFSEQRLGSVRGHHSVLWTTGSLWVLGATGGRRPHGLSSTGLDGVLVTD